MPTIEAFDVEIICVNGVPGPCQELIWDVFFASKGRGINLVTHFPWFVPPEGVFCISAKRPGSSLCGDVIATTVLKTKTDENGVRLGLVGLVCVAEEWRGKGLSALLMTKTTEYARLMDLDALVLWTQKPNVYTRQGFALFNQELHGIVERESTIPVNVNFTSDAWPGPMLEKKQRGLPPFALSGRSIASDSAEVITLDSSNGVTVAEWHGPVSDVVDLLESALPKHWMINVSEKASIIAELSARGFKLDLKLGSMQLVKSLKNSQQVPLSKINFLDRI